MASILTNNMTNNTQHKLKLVTHNGSFHTDDIFAAATLSLYLSNKNQAFEIIRTRDENIIKEGDYVFDVGGVYDEAANRFDHHQVGGAGKRAEGVEYAAFGLVWKKFGAELAGSKLAADFIDKRLVLPIDAFDNGMDLVTNKFPETSPYYLQHLFFAMQPTWREGENHDESFLKSVEIAKAILSREIVHVKDSILAEQEVLAAYKSSKDKRIIVLEKNYPAQYTLHDFPEPLFIVYPRVSDNTWGVKAVRVDPKTFNNRKDFPKAWGGIRDDALQNISGVPDAVFCHKNLFMAVAKSKEGAVQLAQIALKS